MHSNLGLEQDLQKQSGTPLQKERLEFSGVLIAKDSVLVVIEGCHSVPSLLQAGEGF